MSLYDPQTWVDDVTPVDQAHLQHMEAGIEALDNAVTLKEDRANKGVPNGYAPLGADGKVPAAQLPLVSGNPTGPAGGVLAGTYPNPAFAEDMATQAELNAGLATKADTGATNALLDLKEDRANKGIIGGYASLDGTGKLPLAQLPIDITAYQLRSEEGVANGYAGLGPDGKVPFAQLPPGAGIDPSLYQLRSEEDQPGGYLGLNATRGARITDIFEVNGSLRMRSTAAHMGFIDSTVDAPTDTVLSSSPQDLTTLRFRVLGDGKLEWAPGATGVPDTSLRRNGVGILRTDGTLDANALTINGVPVGGGGGGAPSGPAGGVLGGNYPNPTFAADMATQAELDAAVATINTTTGNKVDKDSVTVAATRIVANKLLAGDANAAFQITGDGKFQWGAGGAAALDPAANFYRAGTNHVKTDGQLSTGQNIIIATNYRLLFGSLTDTNLGRQAADTLRTDDDFWVAKAQADTQPQMTLKRDLGGAGLPGIQFGAGGSTAPDVNLYRGAPDRLQTDDMLMVQRTAAPANALGFFIAGEADYRLLATVDGKLNWGPGTGAQDTNLYRAGVGYLKTDGFYMAMKGMYLDYADGGNRLYFGSAADTNLYRSAAGTLKSDSQIMSTSYLTAQFGGANQVLIGYVGSGPGAGIAFHNSGDTSLYRFGSAYLRNGGAGFIADGELYVDYANGGKKIWFGSAADTNLYRSGAGVLYTDGIMGVGGLFYANGGVIRFHPSGDTALSRDSAGVLRTPGQVIINSHLWLGGQLYSNTITAGAVGGAQANKMPIYNYAGAFVGYIPIYAT